MDIQMKAFLEEANLEKQSRDRTLKSGVIHEIHLAEDARKPGQFIDLSDTPESYEDQAKKFLIVNDGKTALLFKLINASDVQPGTFPSGSYVFQGVVTGVMPTLSAHLTTKEYVDLALNVQFDYFLTDTVSGIGGIYYEMHDHESGAGESSFTTAAMGGGDGQALVNFVNVSGEPGVHALQAGIFAMHIHAERTAGTRSVHLYWELYKRTDPGGTETLLVTSEVSAPVTSKASFDIHAAIPTETELGLTDILVVKFYANLGGGSPTTVVLYAEGTSDSHFTIPVAASIFNQIYLRQDGSKPLTANWAVGGKAISGISLLTLDIGAGINEFSTDGTLGGNSDTALLTEKAAKTYIDAQVVSADKATKTTAAWTKSIGAGGDYPDWATMIADMPDLIAHAVTVTIEKGVTLTEICNIKNKHGITSIGTVLFQAEDYFPQAGVIPLATGATATTLVDAGQAWGVDRFIDMWIYIVHGAGTDNGYVTITDSDATSITVAAWPGTEPDNTSRYLILGALIDAEGARVYGIDIRNNTVNVNFRGIGVQSATAYNVHCFLNSFLGMRYCGWRNSSVIGLLVSASSFAQLYYNGIVANALQGILNSGTGIECGLNGISDNGNVGILTQYGGFSEINANFGDNNGEWGTYSLYSGQARIIGVECSGSGGNHSDPGTAGNANADQAAVY